MRTENTHGFSSILLAIAIVLSMAITITFTATPAAADAVILMPGDDPIPNVFNINQGETFLLRHRMAWDEAGVPGYYLVAIYWDYTDPLGVPDNAWHFTLVSATAYIDNNFDNIPDAGLILDNSVSTGDNGSRYTIGVSNATGNDNDGTYNVDIVLRASGPDGQVHENTDNHPIFYTIAQSLESVPPAAAVPLVSVVISEWTNGVFVRGKASPSAYNVDGAGLPPYVDYSPGDRPPIMAAQRVDDGAFVVGGIASSTRNYRWNDTSPLNPDPHLDNLLDAAFQWMVPGATDVLWMEDDVYNDTSQASQLITALTALGYTIVGDDRPLENMYTGWIDSYAGSISENLLSTDDSYAMSDEPENNGDDLSDVHVGRFTYEENDWGYMKWDLSALSAATSITSATLILDTYYDPDNDMTVGFYESDDAWNEDSLSWDNRPTTPITGDTNFNDAYTFATEWDNYGVNNFDYIGWHSGGLGLFISEYIEGTSYNKAIEIYTSSPVDLSNYQLERYSNGATNISSFEVLSGTLDSGDVYVIAHASADAAILAVADLTDAVINHNGDDGYVLRRIGDNTVIDSIGQYGVDPGAEWDPVGSGGKDQTQVRRTSQIATLDMTQIAFGAWWNVDVTDYVQAQFASDNVVSIMLKSENENLPASEAHSVQFASHERSSGVYGPFLEITYEGTVFQEYDYGLENFDILVINQLQRDYADRYVGGDPDKVRATEISIIDSFVRGGGGLLITEGGDYGSHNYARVQNKILDALGSNWWLQHDQVYDDSDNWGAAYEIVTDVDTSTPIGLYYETNTSGSPGKTTVGLYSTASLVAVPLSFDVDVAVGPAIVSVPEDNTATFNVTVTNLGDGDVFDLAVSQNLAWENLTISDDYLNLGVGESDATVTVSFDIPEGTAYCTYNDIYVTATSVTDNSVSDVGSAEGHSTGAPLTLRGVTVDIHDPHQEAVLVVDYDAVKKRYDPLTFKVVVTNEGELWDKYILTATTDSDKQLELWPTEIFLQPGESDMAILSVSIPEDEEGSTLNYIDVQATGTFATGTGEDTENALGGDIATVHIAEAYCVRVDVLPFQVQSATPGSKVRWFARVKNLGNTFNTYEITVTTIVSDYDHLYEPIVATVEPYILELPPCNWDQVQIDIDIPEDLPMSTRIDVIVEVQSLIEETCNDTKEVQVHVIRGIPPIPQGVIKLEVETELIAIQVWPTYWDFGVLDETETASTPTDHFTVRNIGNKAVDVTIRGNDAKSAPGELVTTWILSDFGAIGTDVYQAWYDGSELKTYDTSLINGLPVSAEYDFDLTIQAPSSITVPSRMWTLVNLTASEA